MLFLRRLFFLFLASTQVIYADVYFAPSFVGIKRECPTNKDACVLDYLTYLTKSLCVSSVQKVDPSIWRSTRIQQTLPHYKASTNKPLWVSIEKIRFMQGSASGIFSDFKHDVISTALNLKSGQLKITELPKIEVWQDENGNIWTLNHRRLIAMLLSGVITKVPVVWVDAQTVSKNGFEYTTLNDGKQIVIWMTDTTALVVNHKRCH